MAAFTAADVQSLRKATGAGMLDAKKALEESEGDFEAAAKLLREKGLTNAAKRADRENEQGAVFVTFDGRVGAIAELKCETDFVAKSEAFTQTVEAIARAVAANGEASAKGFAGKIDELKLTLKENIDLGKVARIEASDGEVVDGYLHLQAGRGIVGVLVKLEGGTAELAHDLALHVAFARPNYLTRDQVPAEVVDAERATLETITRNEGKPEAAIPKIVEGRLDGFFKTQCLVEQPYIKDDKLRVNDVLKGAKITDYALVVVGG